MDTVEWVIRYDIVNIKTNLVYTYHVGSVIVSIYDGNNNQFTGKVDKVLEELAEYYPDDTYRIVWTIVRKI